MPAAPDPQLTLPTTVFKSKKTLPRNMLPADYFRVSSQHAHPPLVIMLVLTQLSVGGFLLGLILDAILPAEQAAALRPLNAANALAFGLLALAASTLHLGRPLYAFRAVLGLRHSWLSREIVAFGLFAKLACCYFVALWWFPGGGLTRDWVWLGYAVGASGIIGLFCSAMIYVYTGRECWSFVRVMVRFALTAGLLGIAVVWLSMLMSVVFQPSAALEQLIHDYGTNLCLGVMLVSTLKLAWDAAIFRHLLSRKMTALKRSAMSMRGELFSITLARYCLGILGGILLPMLLLQNLPLEYSSAALARFAAISGMLFISCLFGELLERHLFFSACAAPRMPGGSA